MANTRYFDKECEYYKEHESGICGKDGEHVGIPFQGTFVLCPEHKRTVLGTN